MSNMRDKEKYITICPKCGSDDVSPEQDPAYVDSGLSSQFMQCNNCGHHGFIFPEAPASQVPKKSKETGKIKNIEFVQTSYGRGYFKYLIYIGMPFAVLILLLFLISWK